MPKEMLELFLDEKIINLMIDQSILCAKQNLRHDFARNFFEMIGFIGFLLYSD